jgi:hypothetical protein
MSNVVRPITGTWPPCPPPCPPADCFSGLAHLEQCYADVKRAEALLKQMIKDIIACDPGIIGSGMPIIGVTDGSDAQPGQVGEFVRLIIGNITIPAAYLVQNVTLGVLSPGDWDCWCSCSFTSFISDARMSLNPVPTGFSDEMYVGMATTLESFNLVGPTGRALISVPTLVNMQLTTNLAAEGPAATIGYMIFSARRRR